MAEEVVAVDPLPWHTMTKEEVYKELDLKDDILTTGLTDAEAEERLEKYGYNKLTEKEKETIWQKIWNQINNVLVLILFIVAVISLISAFIIPNDINPRYTNFIQIAIILGVIV
jgi:Ca2+-transporting ATPase